VTRRAKETVQVLKVPTSAAEVHEYGFEPFAFSRRVRAPIPGVLQRCLRDLCEKRQVRSRSANKHHSDPRGIFPITKTKVLSLTHSEAHQRNVPETTRASKHTPKSHSGAPQSADRTMGPGDRRHYEDRLGPQLSPPSPI
jgi:hypothetical protein